LRASADADRRVGQPVPDAAAGTVHRADSSADADLDAIVADRDSRTGAVVPGAAGHERGTTACTRKVSSIREAVTVLGYERIRQWVVLLMASDVAASLAGAAGRHADPGPAVPADRRSTPTSPPTRLHVGLLSGVAELLAEAIEELAPRLPVTTEIAAALVDGSGRLGHVLRLAQAYERSGLPALRERRCRARAARLPERPRLVDDAIATWTPDHPRPSPPRRLVPLARTRARTPARLAARTPVRPQRARRRSSPPPQRRFAAAAAPRPRSWMSVSPTQSVQDRG
jgi:hypothetical protein